MTIQDFALIERATFKFKRGLNVITGESGSGKSVLLAAVQQVIGMAASSEDLIRAPATQADVQATFRLGSAASRTIGALLTDLGLPGSAIPHGEGHAVHVRREIYYANAGDGDAVDGNKPRVRSRCFINGAATQLRVLKQLGTALVDVNGHTAGTALRDPATQLDLLDRLAGTAAGVRAFTGNAARLAELAKKVEGFAELEDEEARAAEQGLVDDIFALELRAGEEVALRQQLARMDGRVASVEACSAAHAAVGEREAEGSAMMRVAAAQKHMQRVRAWEAEGVAAALDTAPSAGDSARPAHGSSFAKSAHDGSGEGQGLEMIEHAQALMYEAEELLEASRQQLEDYIRVFHFDQGQHDAMRRRLATIDALLKECGCRSVEELLALAEDASCTLDQWADLAAELPELQLEEAQLAAEQAQLAVELSRLRRRASGRLRVAVEGCLQRLAMAHSRFDVRIGWESAGPASDGAAASEHARCLQVPPELAEELGESAEGDCYKLQPKGLDRVDFLLAAGPAEPLRPLRAVASGGESARIMLALKASPSLAATPGYPPTPAPGQQAASSRPTRADPPEQAVAPAALPHSGVLSVESSDGSVRMYPLSGAGSFDADTSRLDGSLAALGTPIMLLDEIDSGVGSRLGQPMGQVLRALAAPGQILCVSHVAQVAAHADHHIKVTKAVSADGRTGTSFKVLSAESERADEIAAMMGLDVVAARRLLLDARAA